MYGETQRRLRTKAKLRMKDVADAMGFSVVYVSDIERGRRNPPKHKDIQVIAELFEDVLGYYPCELFIEAASTRGCVEVSLKGSKERMERTWRIANIVEGLPEAELKLLDEYAMELLQNLESPSKIHAKKPPTDPHR